MADSESEMSNNIHRDFYIPTYILAPGASSNSIRLPDVPTCPVLVFINSNSGGQLGGELLRTFRHLLNKYQVFDLGEEAPDSVLRRLYLNIGRLKSNGDQFAAEIEERMRIIVAGGDGTAGWLLGVVSDLKLSQPPPIATVPLGTGNNLPFAFGWGKKNPGTDLNSVISFLKQVMNAKEMKMDSWHILMRMRPQKGGSCDPIAPLELPHSLHAFHRVSPSDELNVARHSHLLLMKVSIHSVEVSGITSAWSSSTTSNTNSLLTGMDAQVSYAFHSDRKMNPDKFKNQLVNQVVHASGDPHQYLSLLGATFAYFESLFMSRNKQKDGLSIWGTLNIAELTKVKIMKKQGEWQDLQIPPSVRSIVCLNLPSFSGGLNPWGTPNSNKRQYRDLTPPFVDDGLLEVVGFRDAWHGLVLLAPKGHGTRLAQAHRIRFEFRKGAADHTFMRIDGEPWKQPLPENDTVVVEISHLGQIKMLATHDCRAKSIHDPSSQFNHEVDSDEENSVDEERRKFGAADTFKIPDEVDVSSLS
ncbi:hypothetical protein RND71_012306 [Anisodus tanguticus]|uniref:Diacylglycerol kinase n=1 Tax=Anisodus tanguticus TaxID=243964 RepID=A0AAE1VPN5_9SOLA|nr:hypothetical protein RND71_012306 [Anisodus tanguticus]